MNFASLSKYFAAFVSGYVGALLPILSAGDMPSQKALATAIAPALLATGLFHTPSPCAQSDRSDPEAGQGESK